MDNQFSFFATASPSADDRLARWEVKPIAAQPFHFEDGKCRDTAYRESLSFKERDLIEHRKLLSGHVIVSRNSSFLLHSKTMPRREILTSSQRMQLLAFPDDEGELIRRYRVGF